MIEPTRAAQLAAQFQTRAAAVETPTAEVKLPIPAIAPDFVFEFVARRVDVLTLLHGGALPEALAQAIFAGEEERAASGREFTAAETLQILRFQQRVAREVCVAPKLVFQPAGPGEIDLREVPFAGELITALYHYALSLSPDVPVATTKGETTLQAVQAFRGGAESADGGNAGRKIRRSAKRVA